MRLLFSNPCLLIEPENLFTPSPESPDLMIHRVWRPAPPAPAPAPPAPAPVQVSAQVSAPAPAAPAPAAKTLQFEYNKGELSTYVKKEGVYKKSQ